MFPIFKCLSLTSLLRIWPCLLLYLKKKKNNHLPNSLIHFLYVKIATSKFLILTKWFVDYFTFSVQISKFSFSQLSFPLSYLKSMCFPFQSWPASPRAFFNNWALLSFLPLSSIYHFTLSSSFLINRSLNQKLWLSEILFYLEVDRLASHSFIDIYQKKAEDP